MQPQRSKEQIHPFKSNSLNRRPRTSNTTEARIPVQPSILPSHHPNAPLWRSSARRPPYLITSLLG